jgi:hypothetical protein
LPSILRVARVGERASALLGRRVAGSFQDAVHQGFVDGHGFETKPGARS